MKPASASTPEADRPVSAGSALDEDPASNWTMRLMETASTAMTWAFSPSGTAEFSDG